MDALERRLAGDSGTVARLARDLLGRIRALTLTIDDLEREISERRAPHGSGPYSGPPVDGAPLT
jgi:hypothetical protein